MLAKSKLILISSHFLKRYYYLSGTVVGSGNEKIRLGVLWESRLQLRRQVHVITYDMGSYI